MINIHGLKNLISTPTRYWPGGKSQLDYLITNMSKDTIRGTIRCNFSDHLPLFICIGKIKVYKTNKSFKGRSYRNFNEDNVITDK